jgi:hypothetical protein
VTIQAEGRDTEQRVTRALQAVYENRSFPGPLISPGTIEYDHKAVRAHWGPIVARNKIVLFGQVPENSFPRKIAGKWVEGRDTNQLDVPNTDNREWWSNYEVPDFPVLDFDTMRSSAAVIGTLFSDSNTSVFDNSFGAAGSLNNAFWYCDDDLVLSGDVGIRGTLIVKGNLTIAGPGRLTIVDTPVPPAVQREYTLIDKAGEGNFPGDNGFAIGDVKPVFTLSNVALHGFVYVQGDLTFNVANANIHGVVWVNGRILSNAGAYNQIHFDPSVNVPSLNVVLVRASWNEITPDTAIAWAHPSP